MTLNVGAELGKIVDGHALDSCVGSIVGSEVGKREGLVGFLVGGRTGAFVGFREGEVADIPSDNHP